MNVVLLLSCVSLCLAYDCTYEDGIQTMKVGESIWHAAGTTQARTDLMKEVFIHVFKRYPEAKQLFTRVNVDDMDSPEFQAHLLRIINSIDILVNFLNDRTSMAAAVKHLADQHASRPGVSAAHFQAMKEGLAIFMPQLLDQFDPDSWNRCSHTMFDPITAQLP